jgi:hypothetical protein
VVFERHNMAGFEDLVTLGLIATGILGGVVLHIRTRAAPIVVAVFLSTGIAGAVYRFLGGIEANFNVRGLQITGTMAALVGFAVILNRALVKQSGFLRVSATSFVGDWFWDYPDEGWTGVLNFKMENRRLTFTGRVEQLTGKGQRGRGTLLYVMSNGTATIIDGKHLELECDTEDTTSGTKFRWRTTEPLGVGFEFAGTFIKVEREPNKDDKSHGSDRWGLSLHKVLYLPSR